MQLSNQNKFQLLILVIIDIFLVALAFYIAFIFRFNSNIPSENFQAFINILPWILLFTILVFYMFDLYTDWKRRSVHNLFYSLILSLIIVNLLCIVASFIFREFAFPRSVLIISFVMQLLLILGYRSVYYWISKSIHGIKKVIIVGKEFENTDLLVDKFHHHSPGWFKVKGYIYFEELTSGFLENKPLNFDAVLINNDLLEDQKSSIVSICAKHGIETLILPNLYELFITNAKTQQIDDMPVMSISPPKLNSNQMFIKRFFDIIISLGLIIILSPIIFLLVILIPLTSRGPALYKQERLGLYGKPFNIYKFRSMVVDAEKDSGPVLASESDPRITSIGKIIRLTRLDELPQLFNVLKGDMSIVGPRPERAYFVEQFNKEVENYSYRMTVKPGITGLAQVLSKYSTTVEDKLRYDLMYVNSYSFALDIKIMLQTIRVILTPEQANGVKEKNAEDKKIKVLSKIIGTK